MGRFIARRLIQAIPTLFGIMLLTFLLTRLSPSDPVQLMVAGNFDITVEDKASLRHSLGLDDPLPVQFGKWLISAAQLDLGNSFYYHRPVTQLIWERIPNTMQYTIPSLILAVVIGAPLGFVAARLRGRFPDHLIRLMSVVLHSLPEFFVGLLVVLILGIQLRWLPVGSMNAVGETCTFCVDRFVHLLGPVIVGALGGIAFYPRLMRTEVLEILGQDYVRTARSKGLRERVILTGHVLRNALIPVVTIFGGLLGIVLSSSLVIEQVFNWPGLGRLLFEGAVNKDYPMVQAVTIVGGVLLLASYILRDIAYAWVDPRIKVR
jgi:peptide/nickel transport system permease protein